MSIQHTTWGNKNPGDVSVESERQPSDSAITVTNHARLRFLQRIDAHAQNPNQRLRKMFRTGSAARAHPDVDAGRAMRAGDVLIVYRGTVDCPTIVTVLHDRTGGQR